MRNICTWCSLRTRVFLHLRVWKEIMSPLCIAHSLTCTRLRMDFRRVLLLLLFCFEPPLLVNCLPILPAENAAPSASESVYLPDEEPVRLSQEERALRLLDTYGEGEGRVFFLHACGALQGLKLVEFHWQCSYEFYPCSANQIAEPAASCIQSGCRSTLDCSCLRECRRGYVPTLLAHS